MENLVYRISGHESSSSASSTRSRPISGHEYSISGLLKSEAQCGTEYIGIPAPVTSVDELAYLRPGCAVNFRTFGKHLSCRS